jgi:hypothetical protein
VLSVAQALVPELEPQAYWPPGLVPVARLQPELQEQQAQDEVVPAPQLKLAPAAWASVPPQV